MPSKVFVDLERPTSMLQSFQHICRKADLYRFARRLLGQARCVWDSLWMMGEVRGEILSTMGHDYYKQKDFTLKRHCIIITIGVVTVGYTGRLGPYSPWDKS